MSGLTAFLTILTLIIGLVIAAINLTNKLLDGLENRTEKVLVKNGIIKKLPDGAEPHDMWPNGWNNLPDSLRGLWQAQEATEAEVHRYHSEDSR